MEMLRPVFWGQGMFLLPQHFQQQDGYHDALLRHCLRLFLPFCWGVKSLVINGEALQTLRFEVTQCEVVTWDGTVLRFSQDQSGNTRLEARSFEHDLPTNERPLAVYLGIQKLQPGESNLQPDAISGGGDGRERASRGLGRFVRKESSVADLYDGKEQTAPLQYLVYEMHLFFGSPPSSDHEVVKIAEIVPAATEKQRWMLSKDYISPCLTVQSSPVLATLTTEIRDRLTSKRQELTQHQRQQGGGLVGLGTKELTAFLALQILNRYIPLLHHVVEQQDVLHPHLVYIWLRQLVSELSTFSASRAALDVWGENKELPPYDHENLRRCFLPAIERITQFLDRLTAPEPEPERIRDTVLRYDGKYFTADLTHDLFTNDNLHYLALKDDRSYKELLPLLQDTGKITSKEEMPNLAGPFVRGLKLEQPEGLPPELPMHDRYKYFVINQQAKTSRHWKAIMGGEDITKANIAINSPSLSPDTEIHLFTVLGKSK